MAFLIRIAEIRAGFRRARHSFDALEQMNALPRDLQQDIGWTLDSRARANAVYYSR